ncbi:MAG: hypothetical protein ACREJU_12575 [Nitrospiraceae bacterium]
MRDPRFASACRIGRDLASVGLRALLAATLATLMTGCIAGMFSTGQGVLLQ